MSLFNDEVTFTYQVHETLLSLKMRETNPAYGFKFKGNDESLLKCYFFLRFREEEGEQGKDSICSQRVLETGHAIRGRIVNFIFNAVDHFGEHREIAFVAIDYLDRFLLTRLRHDNENILPMTTISTNGGVKEIYQVFDLYVLASLGLALKLFSPCSGCPKRGEERNIINDVINSHKVWQHSSMKKYLFLPSTKLRTSVYNGHGYSTFLSLTGGDKRIIEGIAKAEINILSTLQWYVHPPTSCGFIHTVFQFAPPPGVEPELDSLWESLRNFAYFQAELALSNKYTIKFPPSVIATCAICNSIHRHLLGDEELQQNESVKDTLRTILKHMETSLQVSYEFDERVIILKGLLTKQIMKIWQDRIDIIEAKEKNGQNNKFRQQSSLPPQQGNQFPYKNWEQCFFLENLESFFPQKKSPNEKKLSNNTTTINHDDNKRIDKPMDSNDLENHYNKYIRPKLYMMNETTASTAINPRQA